MDVYSLAKIVSITIAVLMILVITGLFVLDRLQNGIRPFSLTDADKADLDELRRDFGLRNILASISVRIGGLLIVMGVLSPVLFKFQWFMFAGLPIAGFILIFLGIFSLRYVVAGWLVRIGGLSIVAGILSPIVCGYVWPIIAGMFTAGIVLILLGFFWGMRNIKQQAMPTPPPDKGKS